MAQEVQCATGILRCEAISPGIARGQLLLLEMPSEALSWHQAGDRPVPAAEIRRFRQRVASLTQDLQDTVEGLESESLSAEADIIRAHILMLNDPEFHNRVDTAIREARVSAEVAVERAIEETAEVLRSLDSPVLAERANDLRDLAEQLRVKLSLQPSRHMPSAASGSILALPELTPSIVLQARRVGVRAFLVEHGTRLSHAAILAKSFGIPTLRVLSVEALRRHQGTQVLVDGKAGELLLEPTEKECLGRLFPVATGKVVPLAAKLPIRLWVSIVEPAQLEDLDWDGVEGVGLYRTETLFMQKTDGFPGEDEQMQVYRGLFALAEGRPVLVRTVDIGADKPVPYLSLGPQDNPSMGMRAHRLFRFHPELIITQIRAILRAAYGHPAVRVMYPMIESLEQWRFIQDLVSRAVTSLHKERVPFLDRFEQCILVETPAAVWDFSRLLKEFDYASVGTNDLIQFLFAVERTNVNLVDLCQPEHPVFLKVLKTLAQECQRAGKPLAVCGEMVSDPNLASVLVGLGATDLSLSPGALWEVRRQLEATTQERCVALADACLAATTTDEVRALLGTTSEAYAKLDNQMEGHAVDPICGMVVQTTGNPMMFEDEGVPYYFCSRIHMLRFMNKIGSDLDE